MNGMCGRFYIENDSEVQTVVRIIRKRGQAPDDLKVSGEFFPGDIVPVIAPDRKKNPTAYAMQWGYHLDKKLIFNARSETAAEKTLFRDGIMGRRCVIPASWYFEWDTQKTRYAIHPGESKAFLAGIYRMEDRPVFTVLTREPGESTRGIHPRMPVILRRDDILRWIDPETDADKLIRSSVTGMICVPFSGISFAEGNIQS